MKVLGSDRHDIERKQVIILRIVSESMDPLGARVIAQRLEEYGIVLGERAVRYHLKLMDERGLTRLIGRDGRVITERGVEELDSALVGDKVGFVISKIELLAVQTTFDWEQRRGQVPVNVSFIPRLQFKRAWEEMRGAFDTGLCVSDLVTVADEGERLAGSYVPEGKVGFASVCSLVINGALLKAGIPMDSRFGGLLQIRDHQPYRFVELIQYSGSSLDPSTIFISSRMTSVAKAVARGDGKVLANFREIPAICRPVAEGVFSGLKEAGIGGLLVTGDTSQPVCEIPVELNKIGVILLGGLNPVAAAVEAGIAIDNSAMSGVIEYEKLIRFSTV
jgi:repressor of nif and glnA expression